MVYAIPVSEDGVPHPEIWIPPPGSSPSRGSSCCLEITVCRWILFLISLMITGGASGSYYRWFLKQPKLEVFVQHDQGQGPKYGPNVLTASEEFERELKLALNERRNYQSRNQRSLDAFQRHYKDFDFDGLNDAVMGMVNAMVKSGKVVTEEPRNPQNKKPFLYRLFKRNAKRKLYRGSEISVPSIHR